MQDVRQVELEFSELVKLLWQVRWAKDPGQASRALNTLRADYPELADKVKADAEARDYLKAYIQMRGIEPELLDDYRYEVDRLLEEPEPDPLDELGELVGLAEIKDEVHKIRDFVAFHLLRRRRGLTSYLPTVHMLFQGAPGTGKTTVARILGRLFKEIEFLPRGHVVEVSRGELVAEYMGQTAPKVQEVIQRALGGILFVDEAYLLTRSDDLRDYGYEALGVLVKQMEDFRDQFVVIFAGYSDEMERFVDANPGLASRITFRLTFPNYTGRELAEIARRLVKRQDFHLTEAAYRHLEEHLGRLNQERGGNGRLARNIIERSIMQKASRVMRKASVTNEELTLLDIDDLCI